jgi:hypothetical protein
VVKTRRDRIAIIVMCIATLIVAGITAYVYAYNNSQALVGGGVSFSLAETEPVENCSEIFPPLDPWTREAIGNLSAMVDVDYSNYFDWKLHDLWSNHESVFKYQGKFYTFDDGVVYDPEGPSGVLMGPAIGGGWVAVGFGWLCVGMVAVRRRKRESL